MSDGVLPRNSGVGCSSPLERLFRSWTEFLLSRHPQSSKNGPHWNDSGDGRRRSCQKTSPRDRWSHANCATEPRVTKCHPLIMARERLSDECRQHSGSSLEKLKIRYWDAGVKLGCRVQVGGDFVVGNPVPTTQAPPPLGKCQKLSVSPVSDHQRQAMSVMPAVRQDSDEESRPEKPLLMDASRKWFLPAVPDVGYRMWAAGRNHHLNREVHIAKASDDVTKMSTPGRRSNRDSPTSDASSEKFPDHCAMPDPSAMGSPRLHQPSRDMTEWCARLLRSS